MPHSLSIGILANSVSGSNSPLGQRRIGAITAIKARAPVLGGNFGVWGGTFMTYSCAVKGVRYAKSSVFDIAPPD